MTFQIEFPDFPAADFPAIPTGFDDTSWHNDACPSISNERMQIWIDYVDPALREHGSSHPRFNVQPMRDGIEITGDGGLTTDDWNAVLAYIAKHTATDYAIVPDHSEPRQSVYRVMHLGKIVETFYSEFEAIDFIEQTTGQTFQSED